MQLQIDTGLKTYDILDAAGNVTGTVRFNPADPGIAARWKSAEPEIQQLAQTAQQTDQDEGATVALLMDADQKIKSLFDYAFGAKVSEAFFGGQSAFGICEDGSLVLEHVLTALTPVLESSMKSGLEAVQQRAKTHIAPYQGTTRGLAPGQTLPD